MHLQASLYERLPGTLVKELLLKGMNKNKRLQQSISDKYAIFTIHGHSFALANRFIQEIVTSVAIHSVPRLTSHPAYVGIMSWHGEICPCIRLQEMPCCVKARSVHSDQSHSQGIILKKDNSSWCLLVDHIEAVMKLDRTSSDQHRVVILDDDELFLSLQTLVV